MLAFTGETRQVLEWFVSTHEVDAVGLGGATWRLRQLPHVGAVADQDARLWQALGIVRRAANAVLNERRAAVDDEKGLRDWHEAQVKARAGK